MCGHARQGHCGRTAARSSLRVMRLSHVLHPVHVLAVDLLLNGDMRHAVHGSGTVPVLHPWRSPDDVTGTDLLLLAAPGLDPPDTGGDNQMLASWVGVPGGTRTRCKGDLTSAGSGVLRRAEEGLHNHVAGEGLCGSVHRRL